MTFEYILVLIYFQTFRSANSPGQYFVREIPVVHETSKRPNGQSQYPMQQGYSTLPRHMQDAQHTGSATLPRSFRTGSPARSGSPMGGRSASPVVREIPIQHIQSSNQSQTSGHQAPPGSYRPAQQGQQGHQAGPYGYTIYTGNSPQGGTPPPGQQAYPGQQPPSFTQSQASSTASASAHGGYPQTSAHASSSAHAGYPESSMHSTTATHHPPSQTSTNTNQSQHSTASQMSQPSQETYSQEPKLRQVPVSHQTSQHTQENVSQGSSHAERSATPGSSRQSPESTGAQSQGEKSNGNSTPKKKKPTTPMEQIEEVISNVKEYSARVNQFQGTKKDKEYKLLEEMLTRNLLKLDGVEAGCDDNVRQKRKQTVRDIQAYLDQLELKAFSQEQSSDAPAKKEEDMQTENDNNSEPPQPCDNDNEKQESMDTSEESDIPRKSVKEMVDKVESAKC